MYVVARSYSCAVNNRWAPTHVPPELLEKPPNTPSPTVIMLLAAWAFDVLQQATDLRKHITTGRADERPVIVVVVVIPPRAPTPEDAPLEDVIVHVTWAPRARFQVDEHCRWAYESTTTVVGHAWDACRRVYYFVLI